MQITKRAEGQRQIGDALVSQDALASVREVAVDGFERSWEPAPTDTSVSAREPISQNADAVAYPASPDEAVYLHIAVEDQVISIPDRKYLLKMLRLL